MSYTISPQSWSASGLRDLILHSFPLNILHVLSENDLYVITLFIQKISNYMGDAQTGQRLQ